MRKVASVIFIVLGCVFAPVALVGYWVTNELADTDRYIQAVAPLATDSAVQEAIEDRVTSAVTQPLRSLGVSAAGDLVRKAVHAVVTGDDFAPIWVDVNRRAHGRFLAVLSGEGSRDPSTRSDTVSFDLGPVCELARQKLVDVGLEVASQLPEMHPTIELSSSAALVRVQTLYSWLISLEWILPILSLILLVAGVFLARDRASALIGVGLGLAAGMVVLAIATTVVRNIWLPGFAGVGMSTSAATAIFDAVTGFLRAGLRLIFAIGLLLSGTVFMNCQNRDFRGWSH